MIKPNSMPPIVVKLGGSLMRRIDRLIPVLLDTKRPLFIVPGGGVLAHSVRKLGIADSTSGHWMAVAAMDQYGWLLASHGLETSDILEVPKKTFVFLPYVSMRKYDPLPHTWDVTSDTIAAWVAGLLNLDLLVLKSVDGIMLSGELKEVVNTQVDCDTVDPFFLDFVIKNKIRTTIINGTIESRVEKYLNGEHVRGTAIGTTF
jgi:5-(aminomethyl)-3-furanmethanol phosphate kinase